MMKRESITFNSAHVPLYIGGGIVLVLVIVAVTLAISSVRSTSIRAQSWWGYSVSANPSVISGCGAISVQYTRPGSASAWIGLYKPNTSDINHMGRSFSIGNASGTMLWPIYEPGLYELRMFVGRYQVVGNRVAMSQPFTVRDSSTAFSVRLSPLQVRYNEDIMVTYNSLPSDGIERVISLERLERGYILPGRLKDISGSGSFVYPQPGRGRFFPAGTYQAYVYTSTLGSDKKCAISNPITVVSDFSISVPNSAVAGSAITLHYTAPEGFQFTDEYIYGPGAYGVALTSLPSAGPNSVSINIPSTRYGGEYTYVLVDPGSGGGESPDASYLAISNPITITSQTPSGSVNYTY